MKYFSFCPYCGQKLNGKLGCLKSLDSSSLRGGATKQSRYCQVFPDCFTSFAMTEQGF
ncbi:MAG: hypothetical protein LBJ47_10085 [Tannerella sp.]|nr:hypothetical protein [Tannerella sp.]